MLKKVLSIYFKKNFLVVFVIFEKEIEQPCGRKVSD